MVTRHQRRQRPTACTGSGSATRHQQAHRDASASRLSAHDQLPDLVGYRVLGRYGELGTVVAAATTDHDLVVRGGVSHALVYVLPIRRIRDVSAKRRTVTADVDVEDFVPSLGDDGTVVLELKQ